MKVTSYGISKRLAEIGFDRAFDFAYKKDDEVNVWNEAFEIRCWDLNISDYYPAYDLETILEALPETTELISESGVVSLFLRLGKNRICYEDATKMSYLHLRRDKESLADTAARLLILLYEKGVVKFN